MRKMKMTEAEDKAMDKRMGFKEGSKADLKQDKKFGIKDNPRKRGKKGKK